MLLNKRQYFSKNQRQLHIMILLFNLAALVLGLLWGLIHWVSEREDRSTNWVATQFTEPQDTLVEFTAVSQANHWFMDQAARDQQVAEIQKKSLEGTPDTFKLIGIVDRKSKLVALFMPINGTASSVKALAIGDTLVGNWRLRELTSSKVVLHAVTEGAESQSQEIKLYGATKN